MKFIKINEEDYTKDKLFVPYNKSKTNRYDFLIHLLDSFIEKPFLTSLFILLIIIIFILIIIIFNNIGII